MMSHPIEICASGLALFGGFIFVMRTLRRSAARDSAAPPPPAFDLLEIQRLLDTGKITPEEHARLRDLVLKQGSESPTAALPPGPRGFEVIPSSQPGEATGRSNSAEQRISAA